MDTGNIVVVDVVGVQGVQGVQGLFFVLEDLENVDAKQQSAICNYNSNVKVEKSEKDKSKIDIVDINALEVLKLNNKLLTKRVDSISCVHPTLSAIRNCVELYQKVNIITFLMTLLTNININKDLKMLKMLKMLNRYYVVQIS